MSSGNKSVRAGSYSVLRGPVSLQALEPRLMFDGAGVVTAADTLVMPENSEQLDVLIGQLTAEGRLPVRMMPLDGWAAPGALVADAAEQGNTGLADTSAALAEDASRSFIFIDTSIVGYDVLVREWTGKGEIVLIDASRDGIDQIRAALAGVQNVDAIHIVSHGDAGMFWLGTTRIDQAAVTGALASSFAAIGAKLSASGDIMLYGCDVGVGAAGQGLLNSLAATTGADVAASLDDTGNAVRGGDWTLESRVGMVENAVLTAEVWEGLLAPALIRLNSATTVLRVFDSAGNLVANSQTGTGFSGGRSVGITAGGLAVWSNAGTVNGQAVDLRAVVVSSTINGASRDVLQFDRPAVGVDDPGLLLVAAGSGGTASIQVRWELVLAGTNTPVAADISFTIADVDGTGGNVNAPTRESLVVDTASLSSFQSAGTSNIRYITNVPGQVTGYGTQNELAAPPTAVSAAKFNWLNTSNWTITYNLARSAAGTAGFTHDGDGDFNLGTGG